MRNLQINPVTMTSIAVAGLVGKEPKTVNRDIREMVAGLDGTDLYHDFLAEKNRRQTRLHQILHSKQICC